MICVSSLASTKRTRSPAKSSYSSCGARRMPRGSGTGCRLTSLARGPSRRIASAGRGGKGRPLAMFPRERRRLAGVHAGARRLHEPPPPSPAPSLPWSPPSTNPPNAALGASHGRRAAAGRERRGGKAAAPPTKLKLGVSDHLSTPKKMESPMMQSENRQAGDARAHSSGSKGV